MLNKSPMDQSFKLQAKNNELTVRTSSGKTNGTQPSQEQNISKPPQLKSYPSQTAQSAAMQPSMKQSNMTPGAMPSTMPGAGMMPYASALPQSMPSTMPGAGMMHYTGMMPGSMPPNMPSAMPSAMSGSGMLPPAGMMPHASMMQGAMPSTKSGAGLIPSPFQSPMQAAMQPSAVHPSAMPPTAMQSAAMQPSAMQPSAMQPFVPGIPAGSTIPGVPPTSQLPTPPGLMPLQQSYIENILRFNLGKVGTFYMTYENNTQWNAKIFKGKVEAAGRDHIIISDPKTGLRTLLLMVNLDYATFDEPLKYTSPYQIGNP